MVMPTDDLSVLRRGQHALQYAIQRTRAAEDARDHERLFIGYVEVTVWAVALDDMLPRLDEEYEARRDADSGGQVLRGLRWARNAGVHALMAIHKDVGGFTFPLGFPAVTTFQPVWLDRASARVRAWSQAGNERAYDEHVAGQSVPATLSAVREFLWSRAIPGQYANDLPWEGLG